MPRINLFLFILVLSHALTSFAEPRFELSGFREVVVSVSDLDSYEKFFINTAGWETRFRQAVNRDQLTAWGIDENTEAEELLMANTGTDKGFIRFVRFKGIPQQQIRPNDQSWDTGGIFDVNIRVKNMPALHQSMQLQGWQAQADPIEYTFGIFHVSEWIARSTDSFRIALIERLAPELEGWPQLKHFSRVFNSTQVVKDLPAALHFYRDILGMQTYLEVNNKSKTEGENVLALPHNLADKVNRQIYILHPDKINDGSIELLAFEGITGRQFDKTHLTAMPNLGTASLRFPVKHIENLFQHLKDNDVTIIQPLSERTIPPYGKVQHFIASTPEGAWMEFYE